MCSKKSILKELLISSILNVITKRIFRPKGEKSDEAIHCNINGLLPSIPRDRTNLPSVDSCSSQ